MLVFYKVKIFLQVFFLSLQNRVAELGHPVVCTCSTHILVHVAWSLIKLSASVLLMREINISLNIMKDEQNCDKMNVYGVQSST